MSLLQLNFDDCVCDPEIVDGYHYVKLIALTFGDCVHTPTEITSFVFGFISLACFGVAFFPQIWLNYTRKSVEGLSFGLMVFWVFGDIGNLIGSILTNQLALQIWVAAYFILLDMLTLLQILWYGYLREKLGLVPHIVYDEVVCESRGMVEDEEQGVNPVGVLRDAVGADEIKDNAVGVGEKRSLSMRILAYSLRALEPLRDLERRCDAREPVTERNYLIGCVFSWISGLLYFFSRTSQIRTNYERKSVEGVSIALFILTLSANIMYGAQIILRGVTLDRNFYMAVLPFIIGSTGTLLFDTILIHQAYIYGGFS
ncbi:PQ loop repeat-domain-containing protein [Obelidium mucronatum]|nr:PQ loop repeat-domain-containing protein [Obelidium mucronatum]